MYSQSKAVRPNLSCFILSEAEGLYQDKKVNML